MISLSNSQCFLISVISRCLFCIAILLTGAHEVYFGFNENWYLLRRMFYTARSKFEYDYMSRFVTRNFLFKCDCAIFELETRSQIGPITQRWVTVQHLGNWELVFRLCRHKCTQDLVQSAVTLKAELLLAVGVSLPLTVVPCIDGRSSDYSSREIYAPDVDTTFLWARRPFSLACSWRFWEKKKVKISIRGWRHWDITQTYRRLWETGRQIEGNAVRKTHKESVTQNYTVSNRVPYRQTGRK